MVYTLELVCTNIDLRTKAEAINRAIERYNAKIYNMQNPKTLTLKEIAEKHITITLESALPLSSPGKALRTLSMDLIANEGFVPSASGQLFRTQLVSETNDTHEQKYPPVRTSSDLSDADLLKGLIDYIVNNKSTGTSTEYRKKRAALDHIKQITIESGIIGSCKK